MTKEESLNYLISQLSEEKSIDTNLVRDGYHSFGELYEHRITLYIALCRFVENNYGMASPVWKTNVHSDGSVWKGWFILGIGYDKGEQITYHIPASKWLECDFTEREKAPDFDGHTSSDVLARLKKL